MKLLNRAAKANTIESMRFALSLYLDKRANGEYDGKYDGYFDRLAHIYERMAGRSIFVMS